MQEIHGDLRFDRWIRVKPVVYYIMERQNEDGGYTFAQWSESSAQDTYLALQILKILGTKPLYRERTIQFLKRLQNSDGSFDSIKVAYYVAESLQELGSAPDRDVKQFIFSLQSPRGGFGSLDVDIEASSEIESTYLSLELLKLLGEPIQPDKTVKFILGLKNPDGSFGIQGYSGLASIYYALASLKLLGFPVNSLYDTIKWIRDCEIPTGGFARTPNAFDAYLVIDDVYYGVKALEILNEAGQYSSQNFNIIGKFQNRNGGFRRSIFLGISTFEATYYALSSLQATSRWA
jgi:hypothetical protein